MSDELDVKNNNGPPGSDDAYAIEQAQLFGLEYLGNGNYKQQQGEGELFNEDFWIGSPTAEVFCQHSRVPQLQGWMTYQYKKAGSTIHTRTLRYKMTTRNGNWYRANMDFRVKASNEKTEKSPDSLWQDGEWHSYVKAVDVSAGSQGLRINIMCQFDGTNNDGDMWGVENYHSI